MKRFLFGLLFALNCCTAAYSADIQYSRLVETTAYTTQDEAAQAALTAIMPTSDHESVEYAGIIVQVGNQFFYTSPVTNSETGEFSLHALFPKTAKFVAIYHTHPSTEETNELFSPNDVKIAKELNVTSYIGVTQSNHIHRYVPGKDRTESFVYSGNRTHSGVISRGTLII